MHLSILNIATFGLAIPPLINIQGALWIIFFVQLLVVFQDPCFLLNLSKGIKIFGGGGECVELGLRGMLWNPWYTFERISPALP